MVLRFVLVSLVASLGFELPETADLNRWIDSSRTWLSAQVEMARVVGDDEIDVVEESATPSPSPQAVAEAEAENLEQSLPESARRPGDAPSIDVVDVDAEPEPDLIQPEIVAARPAVEPEPELEPELLVSQEVPANQDAAFETIVRDMAASFSAEPVAAIALDEPAPPAQSAPQLVQDIEPEPEPSRADRVEVAVKLTGQALQAWMGVLQQTTPLASAR